MKWTTLTAAMVICASVNVADAGLVWRSLQEGLWLLRLLHRAAAARPIAVPIPAVSRPAVPQLRLAATMAAARTLLCSSRLLRQRLW
ncbi:MAG: hypothetical protein R3B91_23055 [Planctomycetaceae bacterium]